MQPTQQKEGALCIRAGRFCHEQQMQTLAWHAEQARELGFFSTAAKKNCRGSGEFIPERRVGAGSERGVPVRPSSCPPKFLRGSGGGVGGIKQGVDQGKNLTKLAREVGFHRNNLANEPY
jgi:hypothetical protein